MSTKKSIDEKIAEAQAKLEQAKNQLKRLESTQKEAERKARTHRLIERGAMLESMIDGADALAIEQIKTILTAALNTESALEAIIMAQEQNGTPAAAATGIRPAEVDAPAQAAQSSGATGTAREVGL